MKVALVLGLALVLGVGAASFAQTLSGSWDSTVSIVPSPVALGIRSELIVTYAMSGWTFSSDTVLTDAGWASQHFDASGALGGFTLGSTLVFNPATVAFTSWTATGALSLAGVTFSGTFTVKPGDTQFVLRGAGTAGTVAIDATVTLGGDNDGICDFDWSGVVVGATFPFCCGDITSTISFDCDGFDYVNFKVAGIAIPALPWVTLNATLTFSMQTKALVLSPTFNFGAVACFNLYIAQAQTGSLALDDIMISGIGLNCEIGGVEFTGISFWGTGTKPGLLVGTPYWEVYQIATTDDGCCGPLGFDVAVYFLSGGLQLFDVAEIDANLSIQISTQFEFSTGISIDLTAGPNAFTKWTVGFLVEW
jgi:hypothetical protein